MREASSCTGSMGVDSPNTLLYPPIDSDRGGPSFTELIQTQAGSVRALVVTVEQSVEDWLATHQDVLEVVQELVLVSVGDGARSAAAANPRTATAPTPGPLPGEPVIEFVPDTENLSELGVSINAHLSETPNDESEQTQTVLYLNSVSALLEVSDTETVFRFLHILTRLVEARGATAYYQLDSSQIDSATISTLSVLFGSDLEGQIDGEPFA